MSFVANLRKKPHYCVLQLEADDAMPPRTVAIDVHPSKIDIFQKHLKNPDSNFNLADYGKVLEMIIGEVSDETLATLKAKYHLS